MSVLVDTCVWSLALWRHDPPATRETEYLGRCIRSGVDLWITGLILQEVLQGFHEDPMSDRLEAQMRPFDILPLERPVFVLAAKIHDVCRTHGLQVGTVDAQVAAAAISYECPLLTSDADFRGIARHFRLALA